MESLNKFTEEEEFTNVHLVLNQLFFSTIFFYAGQKYHGTFSIIKKTDEKYFL